MSERPHRIVVVGGDAAGMSAAHTALRAARAAERAVEVVVLEATTHTSYSACGLPYWIAGEVDSGGDLVARTPAEHRALGVDLRLETRASAIDVAARTVTARSSADAGGAEEVLGYDDLVLATGAAPIVPDWALVDGVPVAGVRSLRDLDDGAAWRALLEGSAREGRPPRHAVVVGGGYIGVEMAEALLGRGLDVALITRGPVLGALEEDQRTRVEDGLRAAGVVLHTARTVARLDVDDAGRVRAVVADDGTVLPADVVVLAVGVEPATALGRAAGVPVGAAGGYLPDAGGRLGPGLWAAGDCCEVEHRLTGERAFLPLGTHANKLGRVVGDNLLGADRRFGGALGTAITRFAHDGVHLEVATTGLGTRAAREAGFDPLALTTEGSTISGYLPGAASVATTVVADRGSRRLLGVQVVGGPGAGKRVDAAAAALWGGLTVDDVAGMDLAYAPPFATVWDALQIAARRLADRL